MDKKIRVLIGKPGLDGHDRGAKLVALALKDAGMEVIYTGLHQSVESIVKAALQEAVDVVGLSIMSGAHLPICRKLVARVQEAGLGDTLLLVGGVIPERDVAALKEMGIQGIFPGGTRFEEMVEFIEKNVVQQGPETVPAPKP